jgi:L-asparaginase II
MTQLSVHTVRGDTVESTHRVSVAVCDATGTLRARSGDVERRTFLRSAAKPFQALPLVLDGAAERFAVSDEELALACASHSSEPRHVAIAKVWLERLGLTEDDLACGPHQPLSLDFTVTEPGVEIAQPERPLTRATNNCSGKHTGMMALALHHGWETAGYHLPEHPVQQRVEAELREWAGITPEEVGRGTDGCGVVSFAISLRATAAAMARLATADTDAPRRVVGAMMRHPELVGGIGRLETALMATYTERLIAKVGAEGVYVAGIRDLGLGLALKVEDGSNWAAVVSLIAVLERLGLDPPPSSVLPQFAERPVLNTRDEPVGAMRAVGEIEVS